MAPETTPSDNPSDKTLQLAALPELADAPPSGGAPLVGSVQLFKGVKVRLQALAGEATMSIGELTTLKTGEVIELDRAADAVIDVTLDGQVIARGELVVVGDQFGVRISELARLEG